LEHVDVRPIVRAETEEPFESIRAKNKRSTLLMKILDAMFHPEVTHG
jgi:hypothetical protein